MLQYKKPLSTGTANYFSFTMEPMIKARGLTKRFSNLTAVDAITFDVAKARIFAFLGPNGAGKSTTIRMMTTLTAPTQGNVFLNGYDCMLEKDMARRSFGIVFQDPSSDEELTAYENMDFHGIVYGLNTVQRRKRIGRLLELVGLWDRKDEYVKVYSQGMRRRLEMARALMHRPKILFLDEPTLGLDPQTRNLIWDYIRKMNREYGMTVFFTTHYMDEAQQMAQEIAVIDMGRIIAAGTCSQIMEKADASNLEEAFLSLTGRPIRPEYASSTDRMRIIRGIR